MSFADIAADVPPRRTDHESCRWCEATAASCRSHEWMTKGRQRCCAVCSGDHDEAERTSR
jgi:hypothetical protein